MLTTRYDIDVQPGGALCYVHASQYDVGSRQFVFHLINTDADAAFELPEDVQAEVRGTKPDGNGFSYEAAIDVDSLDVTVDITAQMTAIAGRVRCEIVLYKGTEGEDGYYQLSTANFIMVVERAALDADTLRSNSEIRQLVEVMNHASEIIAAGAQVQDVIAQVQGYAKSAIDAATNAQDSANEAADQVAGAKSAIEREYTADMQSLRDTLNTAIAETLDSLARWKDSASGEMSASYTENMDEVMRKFAEILAIKTTADNTAAQAVEISQDANTRSVQALEKASTAENELATMSTDIDELKTGLRKYELESGNFFGGAFLDEGTNTLYFTDKSGSVIAEIENIGRGGGGGGGGDSGSSSKISISNISGWQSKTLPRNIDGTCPSCPVTIVWSSLEN